MNPQAKEFVPAHILKRRQEEAERLGELTEQLNKVDIKSDDKGRKENGESSKPGVESSEKVQGNFPNKEKSNEGGASTELKINNSTSTNKQLNNHHTGPENNNQHSDSSSSNNANNNKAVDDGYYPNQEIEDLFDEAEDDRLLLEAGENICEFNGEQFIIPRE